jgi:alkanesulfonate monooxygenase SsuD/methylene tetrahydromethanopterin reductase-like flavin-dependent oxidoreductase (luciferase family)
MLGVNVVAAGTDDEARLLLSSLEQAFLSLRRGQPVPLPPPRAGFSAQLSPPERAGLDEVLGCAAIGSAETVESTLRAFIARTGADELMVTAMIHDHGARLRSYEITADIAARLK